MPVEIVPFKAAGKVFEAIKAGAVDIAFVANEPVRAAEIEFTAPYVLIYGNYMVPKDPALKTVADVDKPGIRIGRRRQFAYDLYLPRTIKNATIVRASTGGGRAMIEPLRQGQAGGRGRRETAAARLSPRIIRKCA